jgi:type II secretory pathway pseudopilin PulG
MNEERTAARGMTLFEVIISISLIAMLLGTLMTFFWQTVRVREQVTRMTDRTQIAEGILGHLAAELRGSVGLDKTGFPVQQFAGARRSITFLTTALPPKDEYAFFTESQQGPVPQDDLREISYSLWVDPEKTTESGDPLVGGIVRTERRATIPAINEEEIAEDEDPLYLRHDLWAHELGYLEFRYFDGAQWTTQWNVTQGNALPHLVQVTVGFDSLTKDELEDRDLQQYPIEQEEFYLGPDKPNPDRYSLIVRIPAADQAFSSRLSRLANPGGGTETYTSGTPANTEAQENSQQQNAQGGGR